MLKRILKNCVIFIESERKVGDSEEITLPVMELNMDEFRNGGMDVPVEVELGMKLMDFEFKMTALDDHVMGLFGRRDQEFVIRGATEDEVTGRVVGAEATVRGRIKKLDRGAWKPGDKAMLTVGVAPIYWKFKVANTTLEEIDPFNFVRIIGGVDQLSRQREALQL
jgi:P2 family phage contractile tail tube protein